MNQLIYLKYSTLINFEIKRILVQYNLQTYWQWVIMIANSCDTIQTQIVNNCVRTEIRAKWQIKRHAAVEEIWAELLEAMDEAYNDLFCIWAYIHQILNRSNLHVVDQVNGVFTHFPPYCFITVEETWLIRGSKKSGPHPVCQLHRVLSLCNMLKQEHHTTPFKVRHQLKYSTKTW